MSTFRDWTSLREAIGRLFERFVKRGARACAISLPPDFAPRRASPRRAVTPIRKAIHGLDLRPDEHEEVRSRRLLDAGGVLCGVSAAV